MELPYDPAIPHLDIYLKKMKTLTGKDICTPMFITALFIIVKIVATLKTTMWPWMDKVLVDVYNRLPLSREGNLSIFDNMDGP